MRNQDAVSAVSSCATRYICNRVRVRVMTLIYDHYPLVAN